MSTTNPAPAAPSNNLIGRSVAWLSNDGRRRAGRVVDISTAYGVEIARVEQTDGFSLVQVARLEVVS